jgi:cysteine-rich repeat protein
VIAFADGPASAQITEVETFTVGEHSIYAPDVAVGTDGTVVFIWTEPEFQSDKQRAVTRRFSAAGIALHAPVEIDTTFNVRETAISVRPDGTMIAAWHRRNNNSAIYARPLNANGWPLAPSFWVTSDDQLIDLRGVAGLSSESPVLWHDSDGVQARRYNASGTAGADFVTDASGVYADAARLADGGFIVVWNGLTDPAGPHLARLYDGDGTPRGPAFSLGVEFRPHRVAVSPNGYAVVVGTGTSTSSNPNGVWMRRLDTAGDLIGSAVLVHPSYTSEEWVPDVELDLQGNALVVWAGTDGTELTTQKVRGRAYDAGNAPLGHEFVIADELATGARVARLANGHFVTVWNPNGGVSAKVLSLCLPGVAQCGDGIQHPDCEQCDDGPGNSDAIADACRTDCGLPRCGDGIVDSTEECDDGNATNCDGCSANCLSETGLVCGDGIPEPTCSQPCDDANGTVGDGCTSQCTLEPIAGGGSRRTDCRIVWIVDNPSNDPLTDKDGRFRSKQRCVDDDPRCDFDGGTPGACTFHVRVCVNASGMVECGTGIRIASWTLERPSAKQAATNPVLAAVRASFGTVPGAIVGPTISDICTEWLPVTLPLRGMPGAYTSSKIILKSRAKPYEGDVDKDKLQLECQPATS